MSVIAILLSSIMISNHVNVVSAGSGWRGFRNSVLGREVIVDEGSQPEEIYLKEQLDQKKAMEDLVKKHVQLKEKATEGKALSKKEMATLNSLNAEFSKISQELREEEFCSEVDICDRAFKSSFFSGRKYILKKEAAQAENLCVKSVIAFKIGKKTYGTASKRHMVQCDIEYKSGLKKVFLIPSTKYDREKNLQYFVLAILNENTYVTPIAYVMNKKEGPKPKVEETGVVKLPASSRNTDDIWKSIALDVEYVQLYTGEMAITNSRPPSPHKYE